jgi:transcriptional regulator with XRE-family HTH domain
MTTTQNTTVTVRQLKAARALLGWSQKDLSMRSGVSLPTTGGLERHEGELGGNDKTRRKLFAALHRAGITFLNVAELGVTLRRAKSKR